MPASELIKVFIASPTELWEERNRLKQQVDELNVLWGDHLGVVLELIKWETHTYPGMGKEPQAVIDEQVGDYDIFIGLLWTHFGALRPAMLVLVQNTNSSVHTAVSKSRLTMFASCFISKTPRSIRTEINPVQLQVSAFKERVGKLGAYYWSYKTPDEFGNLVRGHLTRQVQTFRKSGGSRKGAGRPEATKTAAVPNPSVQGIAAETIQLGFIELLQVANDNFDQIPQSSERIRQTGEDIMRRVEQRTAGKTQP